MVKSLSKPAIRKSLRFFGPSLQWIFGAALCGSLILVSCGGSANSPAPPAPPAPATLQSISVSAPSAIMPAGLKQQYSATGNYSDGTSKAVSSVTWSTSNAAVATVDSTGLVTGLKQGAVTISATSGTATGGTLLT